MESYDAIVVGLGPAGAAASLELCRGGARVLALDGGSWKSKPCGGCISRRWEWLLDWLEAPAWLKEHPVLSFALAAPGAPTLAYRTQDPGAFLVDRSRLDAWLAQRAEAAGAKVIRARAESLEADSQGYTVRAGRDSFRAPWLVGADGAGGLCRRALGLGRSACHRYVAWGEERPADEQSREDGYALIELGGVKRGYGWLFMRGDKINFGLGCWDVPGQRKRGGLRLAYRNLLARLGLGRPGNWRGAAIPCPSFWGGPEAQKGRALLAGDAACAADPFLGEGIGQALYSGRLAARHILAHDPLGYPKNLARTLWREHRHANLLSLLAYARPFWLQRMAGRQPGSIDLGFNLLRGETTHAGLWADLLRGMLGQKPALDRKAGGNYSKWLS